MASNPATGSTAGTVLVFRIGQLGDTLVSLPAIEAIRRRHARQRLVLLTERQARTGVVSAWDVLRPTGWFDDALFYRPARGPWSRLYTVVSLAWRLRRLRFQTVYDLAPERTLAQSRRDRFFFRRVVGIDDYRGGGLLQKPAKNSAGALPRIEPEWRRLLGAAAAESTATPFRFEIPQAERQQAQALLARLSLPVGAVLVGVAPGSKMPSKVWPLERFRDVGERVLRQHSDAFLLVLGGCEDAECGEDLCRAWGERSCNLAGELSVYGSAEVLRQCVAYVGNDTGVMHLAGMVGTPCVALFSARDYPGQWEPYGMRHAVLRHETECAGCMLDMCPYANKCLQLISVEEVLRALQPLMPRPRGATVHS